MKNILLVLLLHSFMFPFLERIYPEDDVNEFSNGQLQIRLYSHRFKEDIVFNRMDDEVFNRMKDDTGVNQCDSLYHLLDFSDSTSCILYSKQEDSLIKFVNLEGVDDPDGYGFIWRFAPDGRLEYGRISSKSYSNDFGLFNALSHFIANHAGYKFFTIPYISGVWGIKDKEIIYLALFRCKPNKNKVKLLPRNTIHVSEPELNPIARPFNEWMLQNILDDVPRYLSMDGNDEYTANGKIYFRCDDIIIISQNGQEVFMDILNQIGYSGISNLILAADPMFVFR